MSRSSSAKNFPISAMSKQDYLHCNQIAKLAQKIWLSQIERYPYIYNHHCVVMPNHLHAIIEYRQDLMASEFDPISLSKWIAQYKSQSTVFIRRTGLSQFKWQRGFHDHIIRNHHAYLHLAKYIANDSTS